MPDHRSAAVDALVIGSGPAGAVAARAVATTGHRVTVVESSGPERSDHGSVLLTPSTVATVERLGLSDAIAGSHRIDHVRFSTEEGRSTRRWPSHPDIGDHGVVVGRAALGRTLTELAQVAGADVRFGCEASAPIVERGFVRGARVGGATAVDDLRAEYVVVADGANSRFGRALGSFRDPSFPYALAHHAVYRSTIADATEIEIVVDLRDRNSTPIAGYGWMFPNGSGEIDVGVLIHSTSPSFRVLDPAQVLRRFVERWGSAWNVDASSPIRSGGGRIPLARSVGPVAGPTWLLTGDAAGAADPWSGAGIGPAIVSGATAGDVVSEALDSGTAAALQKYPQMLDEVFEPSYSVGRLAVGLVRRPLLSRWVGHSVVRSDTTAETVLRLAGGALRPGRLGPAELSFRVARALGVLLPGVGPPGG